MEAGGRASEFKRKWPLGRRPGCQARPLRIPVRRGRSMDAGPECERDRPESFRRTQFGPHRLALNRLSRFHSWLSCARAQPQALLRSLFAGILLFEVRCSMLEQRLQQKVTCQPPRKLLVYSREAGSPNFFTTAPR